MPRRKQEGNENQNVAWNGQPIPNIQSNEQNGNGATEAVTQNSEDPHSIDPNKAIVQSVHYENGGISAVQFQNGQVVDVASAIAMTEAGLIEDMNTGRNRQSEKTLKSYPDGDPSNNLSNLPRF